MTYSPAVIRINRFTNSLWLLLPLLGFGLLTWAGFLIIAIRRRSSVGYWISVVVWFIAGTFTLVRAISGQSPADIVGNFVFLWAGGLTHALVANAVFLSWLNRRAGGSDAVGLIQPAPYQQPAQYQQPGQGFPATGSQGYPPVAPYRPIATPGPLGSPGMMPIPAPVPPSAPPPAAPASTGDAVLDELSGTALAAEYYQAPAGTGGIPAPAAASAAPSFPLDANTASREQLAFVPGIDAATIERIVTAREARTFVSMRDLIAAAGVAPHVFARLEPNLTVVSAPTRQTPADGSTARKGRRLDF